MTNMFPIQSLYELRDLLETTSSGLRRIISNKERYYYESLKPKLDHRNQQRYDRQGNPMMRILTPSFGDLKRMQKLLNPYFQQVPFPECVHGSIVGKDYITNAASHAGSSIFFCTDLKDF